MNVFTLPRTGMPTVRFTGTILATTPVRIGRELAQRGRWCQLTAFSLTYSPLLLLHVHYSTDHLEEHNVHLVTLTPDVQRYLTTIDPSAWVRGPPAARAALLEQYHDASAQLLAALEKPERLCG